MRILYLIHSLRKGGAERLCLQMAHHFAKQGDDVQILTFTKCLEYEDSIDRRFVSIDHLFHKVRWRHDFLKLIYKTHRYIKSFQPEIIHAHLPSSGIILLYATKKPFILTLHSTSYWFWKCGSISNRLMNFVEKKSITSQQSLPVAVSQEVAKAYASHYGLHPTQIRTIENGVNVNEFQRKENFKKNNKNFNILMVGTLSQTKNHQMAIMAFSHLINSIPTARLKIAGGGTFKDKLESKIKKLNLSCYIKLLGQRSDIKSLFEEADIFWHTSISEGLSLVIMEAMAMKVPIITTDIPGVRSICIDGTNCLLVESENHYSLVQKTIDLYNHPKKAANLASKAYNHIKNKFNIDRMYKGYKRLYMNVQSGDFDV